MKANRKESIYTGVYPYNKTKWASCLCIAGYRKYLGIYSSEIEAHEVFMKAYNRLDIETQKKVVNKKKLNLTITN